MKRLSTFLLLFIPFFIKSQLLFDADEGDVITIPYKEGFTFGQEDFAFEGIIKANIVQEMTILSNIGENNSGLLIGVNNNGQLFLQHQSITISLSQESETNLLDNKYHHVAISRSNDTIYSYIDGNLENHVIYSSNLSSSNTLYLGNNRYYNSGFTGVLGDIRIWSNHRSASKIMAYKDSMLLGTEQQLLAYWKLNELDAQVINDYSNHSFEGFPGINLLTEENNPEHLNHDFNYDFNPFEDDRVTIPYHSNYNIEYNDFTLEAVIKADSKQNDYPQILSNRTESHNGFLFGLWNDGRPYLRMEWGNFFYNKGSGKDLRDGKTHHIAFSKKNGITSLYVDGKFEDSVEDNVNISTIGPLYIGNDYQSAGVAFNGQIQEVRFWNTARTNTEIISHKNSSLTGSENELIGYWKLDEDEGQIAHDYSTLENHGSLGTSGQSEEKDPELFQEAFNLVQAKKTSDEPIIEDTDEIYVFRKYSPNHDGENDCLYLDNIKENTIIHFDLYSELGDFIYSEKSYINDSYCFDNLPSGVYYLHLEVNNKIIKTNILLK